ncbi:heterokaryon incompatibility protein-domain-containing protein [Hyaloscypha finlandica]|nr:heterokaryon incompatibility protein-domain-containing protein [Hyaloscypha finlandica]
MSASLPESKNHSGELQHQTKCKICDDLQRVGQTLSLTLSQVSEAATGGCQTCSILKESCTYARDVLHELDAEQDAQVSLQIPVVDDGFPMIVGISDIDGGYSFNEVYTVSGCAKAPWLLIGEGSERTITTEKTFQVLRGWIDTCLTSHPACARQQKKLPTRVLDVSSHNPSLRASHGDKEPYAALSHCWGKSPLIQTHRDTLRDRFDAIPWKNLSKTFQDAVTTTRELGLRYLWIDSLCIVQDDPEDWARESGKMASIYEGAQVVLAASDAKDGHDGFLRPRSGSASPKSIFQGIESKGNPYSIRIRKGDYHKWYGDALPPRSRISPDSSPLSTRGWAFQERLLATRYVQFRSEELIWECRSALWCECGALTRPSQQREPLSKKAFYDTLGSATHPEIFSLWSKIVNAYAIKALTNGGDVLPALSGLAKQFQKSNAGTYLAGLWEADFPLCLLWEAHAVKASPYRAPSWSWASMDTSIPGSSLLTESTFESKTSYPTTVLATVESVSCTSDSSDPTGRISAGYLVITGKILDIIATEPVDNHEDTSMQGWFDWDARLARQPRPYGSKWIPRRRVENFTFRFHADTPLSDPRELTCLLIGEIPTSQAPRALVLRKLCLGGGQVVYERVGLIDRVIFGSSVRSYNWMYLFEHAPTDTITIV